MFFLLRISVEVLPLALLTPLLWVAIGVAFGLSVVSRRLTRPTDPASNRRLMTELSLLVALPVLILAWGLFFWPDNLAARSPHESQALFGLYVLVGVQFAVAAWLVWRHRARWVPTLAVTCCALWWTAGAMFTATMAITNTWL